MLSVGIAEGLDRMLLQHYWGTIAAAACGTSELLLLSSKEVYTELRIQTYLGMHIRSNTLNSCYISDEVVQDAKSL